jgi:hypothetical protein
MVCRDKRWIRPWGLANQSYELGGGGMSRVRANRKSSENLKSYFKSTVLTLKKTENFSITKINSLILFK